MVIHTATGSTTDTAVATGAEWNAEKMWTLPLALVVMVVLLGDPRGAAGELPPLEKPFRILVLMPVSPWSHRNFIMPIAKALADRGHQVVTLSKSSLSSSSSPSSDPNMRELTTWLSIYEEHINFFELRKHPLSFLWTFRHELSLLARNIYNDTTIRSLYDARKEFDAVIIDSLFHEALYPFVHGLPFVMVSTLGEDYQLSAVLGNVQHPAYVPTKLWDFPRPWRLHNKVYNVFAHLANALVWRMWVVPSIQREVWKYFPDLPPLLEIERNQSLTFLNSHFSIDLTLPLLPSQVQVGAIHCKPAKPLPQDLWSWMEGAGSAGVIYISLGSMTRGSSMPIQYRHFFVHAFKQLEQRVIWKYEEDVPGLSENVLVRRWLPQQDILADPRVKVFVTHGGLLSLQEAVYHATPVVVIPIYGDQPRVAALIHNSGYGRWLEWEQLTVHLLLEAIRDVSNSTRYKEQVARASQRLRDQPESAKERAVFWTEYIVRHQGAPHLRSPATQLSWAEFFLLDVVVVVAAAASAVVFLLRQVLRILRRGRAKQKMD